MGHNTHTQQKVGWGGYLAFFITIILFSGMFAKSTEWWRVFDFTVLNGAFGQINAAGDTAVSFRGSGGMGAKDGFLFALELAPSVILSLGIISVTEGLGGLRAAQQLMTPVLRPLLGIPGVCSLALIANLQNTDAAAGMTKEMAEEGIITEQERAIFCLLANQRQRLYYQLFFLGSRVVYDGYRSGDYAAGGDPRVQICGG